MNLLRFLSIVVVMIAPLIAGAQFHTPTSEGLDRVTTQPLRKGRLVVWISTESASDPTWDSVCAELKDNYPALQLDWKVFQRNDFLAALNGTLSAGKTPDVVFADNYAQQGPLHESGKHTFMAGVPRLKDRGWWTIMEGAPDRNEAQAFFLWLEQPKTPPYPRPVKQLRAETDRNQIISATVKTIRAFGSSPVETPSDVLDPEFAPLSWSLTRPTEAPQGEKESYSPSVEDIRGNARLAFVTVSVREHGEQTFGLIHAFLILRKSGAFWRVLFLDPSDSSARTEQLFLKLDAFAFQDGLPITEKYITLLAPGEGERIPRFPKTEIAFKTDRDSAKLIAIESEYVADSRWSPSHIDWVSTSPDATGIVRVPVPFGVGMQLHRWRVWNLDRAGTVTLSEWRKIDFAN